VILIVVTGLFLAVVASAARDLAAVLAQFLRVAAAMTFAAVFMVAVVVMAVALLIHH
jgi:hypothetical protein